MVEVLLLFFQLLLFLLLLVIIGEPVRVVVSRYSRLLKNLDILQILVINVYLGGLILYAISMVPLSLFNETLACGIIIVFAVLSLFLHRKKVGRMRSIFQSNLVLSSIHDYFSKYRLALLESIIVLCMFLAALWIQVTPLPRFVFGSIHDTSLHALFTEIILENGYVPSTMQPYLPEGVVYPQAAHVFFAYGCYMLGYVPPETILYVTALFQALGVLAAYYLGKALSSRPLGVSLAFIFLCVSRWPRLLTWGANPYLLAFPLQFILFSFIPPLLNWKAEMKLEKKMLKFLAVGILFGYLAALHLTLYIILLTSAAIFVFVIAIRERTSSKVGNLLITLGFSLIPLTPFIYRFVSWYPYSGHNIGLPLDITIYVSESPFPLLNTLNWLMFQEGISPYLPLVVAFIGLVIISFSGLGFFMKREKFAKMSNGVQIASCSLIASLVLFASFHLQYVFPPLAIIMGEVARPVISLVISLCFLIGIFNVILYNMLTNRIRTKLLSIFLPSKHALAKAVAAILAITFFLLIYSPFLYYAVAHDAEYLYESYGRYAVTTRDDYELMLWIRERLPKDVIILVNPHGPGMLIPSVSYRKAIYPQVASKYSQSYQKLINMTQQGILNAELYDVMEGLHITHVYVGSRASHWWEANYKWDPQLFLSNPSFNLVKKIGGAFLFEVAYKNPNVVFEESFEYENIVNMGWEFHETEENVSNGTGYLNTTFSKCTYNGQRSAVITAKKDAGAFYADWMYRKVYVWNASNIDFCFYINASEGFQSPDGISIYIYEPSWERYVRFMTPDQPCNGNESIILLQKSVGFFQFNLSRIWVQQYNSTLPTAFLVVIQNVDFDGIENVAYIDYIRVEVNDR